MATITDIKRRIQELGAAQFQEFCDTLISKKGYGVIHGYGMKAGTGSTTIGNPDTYFRKENGKYVFVAYTIQQSNIYSKLNEDIVKCLDPNKTGLSISEIEEIICCHISSNLSAGDDKKLHDYCMTQGVSLTIWGIDEIANQVHNQYRSMAKDFLGLSIDTNQILSIEDFIALSDLNGMSAPLSTEFQYREKEKEDITETLETESVVIITGKAGVGKTRLVLEVARIFAMEKGYKLLCVKNNNLGLYDDLVAMTEKTGKYLFFVDDANELAELNQILSYTTKKRQGFEVKIIATVRDYAKSKVIETAREYVLPKVIEIFRFSDEEVKGFLNDNLGIKNEDYLKQIIRIAEGNPRIAYMAGRLAVQKQNLSAIRDVSELYDAYYEKYVDGTLGKDRAICFTAGVLSVVGAVTLDNMSAFQELLDIYGICSWEFKNKIHELSRLEVAEIQLNQVAVLSDQCLANYMLYYVFLQKKIIPLSKVLEVGYKCFRNGVFKAVNAIFNLFESEESNAYCKQEILNAWDKLKIEKHSCFEDFARDFHVFKPEDGFLMASQKIKAIENEEFNVHDIDFSINTLSQDKSVLNFLSGYRNSDYLDYVMELLLEYAGRTRETIISGYRWLEKYYGICASDYMYEYFTQRKISSYLLSAVSKQMSVAMSIGFQWVKYSLAFSFHFFEMGKGRMYTSYFLELKYSESIREYRKVCWEILAALATKEEWKNKVILLLEDYARSLFRKQDKEIVVSEIECVEHILSILVCKKISFLKAVKRIIMNTERIGVKYNEKWDGIFTGKIWELYQLLENDSVLSEGDYEEYRNDRDNKLLEYGNKIMVSEIQTLVYDVNSILSDELIKKDSYNINQGLELIISQLDKVRLQVFLNAFIQFGGNISIRPDIVLTSLNQNSDSNELLSIIKEKSFPQQNEWMFSFFETLPESKVNSDMLKEFLTFLGNDTDKEITLSGCRRLRVLDKFITVEPNIYPKASMIIYEKRHYSRFMVNIYFKCFFCDSEYSPKEILRLYRNDIKLLRDIYFFMLEEDGHNDYRGTFLIEFLSLDETWLQKYSELLWKQERKCSDLGYHRNSTLWRDENFIKYFDYIFYHALKEKLHRWEIGFIFKGLLIDIENDDVVRRHQKEWITHLIIESALTDKIGTIFNFICELDDERKRDAIQTFLNNNTDFEVFDKLTIVPNHFSGNESFIPAYQRQIDFLESLYSIVSGMEFLKHRMKIKAKIVELQKMIKQEEVEVIFRNLYM